jgi:putative hemolysin
MFGPAIEGEWNVFTAKMIRKSGATVVPFYFTGANSRRYQVANQISPVLRQGLLIHEVVHAFDKPQAPVIGAPIRTGGMGRPHRPPARIHGLAAGAHAVC